MTFWESVRFWLAKQAVEGALGLAAVAVLTAIVAVAYAAEAVVDWIERKRDRGREAEK